MSDRTAENSTNGQGGPGDRQPESASEIPASQNSEHSSDSPQHRQQICQQETDLNYYRKFLEDLVAVMRDAHSDSVAQLVLLIRSGASNEEIHLALQRVRDES
ncbi:hypothetical protein Pdw03_0523 [Penicillium digitatum]|uniref:Uncharacterized protein n=3 Tax=Penicillium digitatum TaxID=36651 RepID=K9FRW0_PEND2|nr:hypothetical protein PDIP_86990 [Penicillium digitatum Pd1]EKV04529.1 hypothetical protein PDIP_86990 [Penicillium digitatum Pd1]EKV05468.1 hypothetical protein PDIG_83200 [Penicillium digitatum PHI26]QQK45625.1 hypothetical protein Pdw03_0523 [Penicillium digitatum]